MKKLLKTAVFGILVISIAACKKDNDNNINNNNNNPAGNGMSGKIVYETVTDGIYEYDVKTKSNTAIINDAFQPQRLSNGETLHIIGEKNSGPYLKSEKVGIMSADHTSRTLLFDLEGNTLDDPQISPDGNFVAFSYAVSSGSTIYKNASATVIVNKDGSFKAAFDSTSHPSWLPDGRLVVDGNFQYWSWGSLAEGTKQRPGLYITDKDFKKLTLITTGINGPKPIMPAVNNAGDKIAFIMNRDLYTINVDGSNMKRLTNSASQLSYPAWSADGKYIVVTGGVPRPPYTGLQAALAAIPSDADAVELNENTSHYLKTNNDAYLNGWNQKSWK